MIKSEKERVVSEIRQKFNDSNIALLTEFKGLSVEEITKLRTDLRKEKIEYKVVKNTLARIAVKGTPGEALADEFTGPIGVVFGYDEPTAPPRVLVKFAKDNEKLVLKVASFEGKKIDLNQIKALASLPTREQMMTQMAGLLAAPLRNMANCLVAVPRGFLNCMVALKEQKEKSN